MKLLFNHVKFHCMQQLKTKISITFLLLAIGSVITAFTLPGGDMYEIRLNNKVLLKQFVLQKEAIKAVSLNNVNANDELTVYYSHCGHTGKGRTIAVKDSKGSTISKWDFKDASSSYNGMVIPVKELLQLEKKNKGSLSLYYASKELPEGRMLSTLELTAKSLAHGPATKEWPGWNAGLILRVTP